MPYTAYIDESGEAGIAQVRLANKGGASPYFVLGAAVFEPAGEVLARRRIEDFRKAINKSAWKHATELNHNDKVLLARTLGLLPTRYFAVISNKSTLSEEYKDLIDNDPQKFYNKCVVYLLERVCAYLSLQGVTQDDLSVVFEERNHDYDRMIRFIQKVRDNPIYDQSKALSVLNPFSITRKKKGTEFCLEVADFVAHAVFQCSNKSIANHFIPEPRYFSEISSRFAGDSKGTILTTGLKCIHSLGQLELDDDINRIFQNARVKLPRKSSL